MTDEARRVLRRLEFHYVPKHANWLNMVEIEIGVLASQCLDRRIETFTRLLAETAAWEKRRNAERARINWMARPKRPAPKWRAPIPSLQPLQPDVNESKPLCRGTRCSFDRAAPRQAAGRRHLPLRNQFRPSPRRNRSWTMTPSHSRAAVPERWCLLQRARPYRAAG